ncbi:MAG: TIR domain-containing protein [Candidatus Lokiarchaeota archaeon]|nr:TIR domain-containing protein [Candidatus Lokiarchaeota archaeon]
MKCDACGLNFKPNSDEYRKYSTEFNICPYCTANYSKDPDYSEIVLSLIFGYFSIKKKMDNINNSHQLAKVIVEELPYWKNIIFSKNTDRQKIKFKFDNMLKMAEKMINMADFEETSAIREVFISYSWDDKNVEIINKVVKRFGKNGYSVWFDREQFGLKSGKTRDTLRNGITHAKFFIPFLSKEYFLSENCKFELDTGLSTHENQYIIPIWGEGINREFLLSQKHGEDVLSIVGLNMNEFKDNWGQLHNRLNSMIYDAWGFEEYEGFNIHAAEVRMLNNLKNYVNHVTLEVGDGRQISEEETKNPFFRDLTDCIIQLDGNHVRTLDIHRSNLNGLPDFFDQCYMITNLYIRKSNLKKIPEFIFKLPKLRKVGFTVNRISDIEFPREKNERLSTLWLSGNRIKKINENIKNLQGLGLLSLTDNYLEDLPTSFGSLTNLQSLYLSGNVFKKFPTCVCELVNLKVLDFDDDKTMAYGKDVNMIRRLPDSLSNLVNLERLIITNNGLTELPDIFGSLTRLSQLTLRKNKITDLPQSIGNLSNLEILDLRDNKLTEIPDFIKNLKSLMTLSLDYNPIREIPDWIDDLKKSGCEISMMGINSSL